MRDVKKSNRRAEGFSLMELLAVMAIMALLTTLAVTSYFGAVRGMARRSAVSHFANTLILARQRACMENSRICVMAFNEITGAQNTDVTPSYVVCKELGRLTFINAGSSPINLVDEFTEIDKMFGLLKLDYNYRGSVRLYNLSKGKWSNVYPWVEQYPFQQEVGLKNRRSASGHPYMTTAEKNNGYTLNAFAFGINETIPNANAADSDWRVGDPYGIEVAPVAALPRFFEFQTLGKSVSSAITVTFTPDGRARKAQSVVIIETQPPYKRTGVTVGTDGSIAFDGKWK